MYNACIIEREHDVPYLATAVWLPGKGVADITALSRNEIQDQKIDIYKQVIKSCEALIEKKQKQDDSDFGGKMVSLFRKNEAQPVVQQPSNPGPGRPQGNGAVNRVMPAAQPPPPQIMQIQPSVAVRILHNNCLCHFIHFADLALIGLELWKFG